MSAWLQNLIEQLQALPPGRRLVLAVTGAGSLAFFLWLAFGASGAQYRALYRGLPEDEVARVADALRSESIEYRLSDGGTSILVPAGQVYEARIRVPPGMQALMSASNPTGPSADGVYEFFFCAPPLPITGGCGSPLNPIAIK